MSEPLRKKPTADESALKPEMRDLILKFDAKDRRTSAAKNGGGSKQRRRRSDKPAQQL
jgi:hypothetical protein